MKKLFLFFAFVLIGFLSRVQTDNAPGEVYNGRGVVFGLEWRALFPSSRDGVKMRSIEAELLWGYQFNSAFTLFVPGTWTTGFFKMDKAKTYETTGQLGLGLGYSPLHTHSDRLELSLRSGSTLGGEWQYLYYDCGLRWQSDAIWSPLYVGVGVRYYDCYGGGIEDYCNFYIAVGVRILHKCNSRR